MRRRTRELTGEVPMGDQRIPYDRTDPMQQVPTPPGPQQGGAPPDMPPGAPDLGVVGGPPGVGPDPGAGGLLGGADPGLGGAPDQGGLAGGDPLGGAGPGNSDQLTGADLASLADTGQMSPEDLQIEQIDQALNDPNTPPEVRAQLQQLMDLAARRRMVQMGGGQQQQPDQMLGGGLAG